MLEVKIEELILQLSKLKYSSPGLVQFILQFCIKRQKNVSSLFSK